MVDEVRESKELRAFIFINNYAVLCNKVNEFNYKPPLVLFTTTRHSPEYSHCFADVVSNELRLFCSQMKL